MIPAMVVPVLTRPELLYRMLASVDAKVDHLIVIDNGGCVDDFECYDNEQIQRVSVIHMPANLGVAGSWNLGIKAAPFASWWLVCNFDITWPAGSLARFVSEARVGALVLSGGAPPWCAFVIGEEVVERVGLFDESLHPAYFEDDDMVRRCYEAGLPIVRSGIPVQHENSSTLAAGYQARNSVTFGANAAYYGGKVARDDFSEGRWSLTRRRDLSWD